MISLTAGGCQRMSLCQECGIAVLVGGTRFVEIIQELLIGKEGSQEAIILSLGGSPGIPLMGMCVLVPGVVTVGAVPGVGPVIGRLWVALPMIPTGAGVLIFLAIGLLGSPSSRWNLDSFQSW